MLSAKSWDGLERQKWNFTQVVILMSEYMYSELDSFVSELSFLNNELCAAKTSHFRLSS